MEKQTKLNVNREPLRQAAGRTVAGIVVLALLPTTLAGCIGAGKQTPEPVAAEVAPAEAQGPSVTRLEDGRDGFIIMDTPRLDAGARSDFESAVAMLNDRNYDGAIELLERVIERSPEVTAAHIDVAIAYARKGEAEPAEQHLQRALQLFPDHPVASHAYALLLRRGGRFAEARTIYEKTLAAFPEYLPARRNLGILCDLYLDDLSCALEQYEIYSEAMPADEQVKLWVADLRARLGRQDGG